jgi:hypothetical protein
MPMIMRQLASLLALPVVVTVVVPVWIVRRDQIVFTVVLMTVGLVQPIG